MPQETGPGERRVALVPDGVRGLVEQGVDVLVERGAGDAAAYPDSTYEHAGARLVAADELYAQADLIARIGKPDVERLRDGQAVVAFLQPLVDAELARALAARGVTSFSMDAIPRITRAQPMDALSSQSDRRRLQGRAARRGARCRKFFPLLMTAAGTLAPARVFVIGAGVAGLQAIATARRLGAVVEAFDTRPVVKEQVQSLGATFVEVALGGPSRGRGRVREGAFGGCSTSGSSELVAGARRGADVVITTALIPGKRAPILITADTVASDAARTRSSSIWPRRRAATVSCTVPGETGRRARRHDHRRRSNLVEPMPVHASQMLLAEPRRASSAARRRTASSPSTSRTRSFARPASRTTERSCNVSASGDRGRQRERRSSSSALYIFVLAVFVGFEVIAKVPTLLHTPLMSGTNAIYGIIVDRCDPRRRRGRHAARQDPWRSSAVVLGDDQRRRRLPR